MLTHTPEERLGRTIAIMNQKGGVGKTTTSVNLAAALAQQGKKVCLIDMDPQAHASLHCGVMLEPDENSVYEILTDSMSLADVVTQVDEQFDLVGSTLDLAGIEVELAGMVGREMVLRDHLEKESQHYDYTLIDCPPSLGILTLNALTAVSEVFIPLQPQFFALHGLGKLLETIQLVASRLNPTLTLGGVVLCLYDQNTRLAEEVTSDVLDFFAQASQQKGSPWSHARIFESRIRRNIRLAEAPGHGQSIFQYAPKSNGAEDYRLLAEEVIKQSARDQLQRSA